MRQERFVVVGLCLVEAELAAGRKEIAAVDHRNAIELDPENGNTLEKLAEIEGGKSPGAK